MTLVQARALARSAVPAYAKEVELRYKEHLQGAGNAVDLVQVWQPYVLTSLCIYMYVCMYAYICMYVCIHMYVCMYAYLSVYIHV